MSLAPAQATGRALAEGDAVAGSLELALVGALLLATGAAAWPVARYLLRRLYPRRELEPVQRGLAQVIQLGALFLLAQIAVPLVWPAGEETGIAGLLARSVAVFGLSGSGAVLIARQLEPRGVGSLGLVRGGNVRAVLAGLAALCLLLPAIFGAGLAWPWLLETLGHAWEEQSVVEAFRAASGTELSLAIVLAVAVQPFLEELLFRGFLQPALVRGLGAEGGVALTSLLFAGLHGLDAFLPVFLLSLLLGVVMLRTRRLLAAWAVHGVYNGAMLALLLNEILPGPASIVLP